MKTIIYLICEPIMIYGRYGNQLEHGEQVLFGFSLKEKALIKLEELNKDIEEEEGDLPYFIKSFILE